MNDIDEDTSAWLGCPTPLEMYKHQCALLEDELTATQQLLSNARANIAGLVQMNDLLATGMASAEAKLRKAQAEVSRTNLENSESCKKIMGLMMMSSQNEHLIRENQRLLLELTVLRGPQS